MNQVFNARLFVRHWFDINGLSVREALTKEIAFSSMYLDYLDSYNVLAGQRAANKDKTPKPLPERELNHAYNEFLAMQVEVELQQACEPVSFNGGTLEPLIRWITAVTGSSLETDVNVIAHWIWLVKRKSLGLPVKHHVMPVLYGAQGGGKSSAVEALLGPLLKFRLNLDMEQLGDSRIYKGFANNLLVFFDELQKIERADLNVLKNQITTSYNSYRPLHTNLIVNAPMRCSFIGATNKPLNENFSDSTGMRRFFQINTLKTLDWETINSIDYTQVWSCINENLKDGYLHGKQLKEVQFRQEQLINPEELTIFIKDCNLEIESREHTVEMSSSALYLHYQEWCARNGIKTLNSVWFNRKLINLETLPSTEVRDESGVRKRHYTINSRATIVKPVTLAVAR